MNSYPSYKDSGVEWIGEIPIGWEINRIKFITNHNELKLSEKTEPDYELNYVEIGNVKNQKIISKTTDKFKNIPVSGRRVVRKNDILISCVRTYLKSITIIENDVKNLICSTGFCVLSDTKEVNQKYLFYNVLTDGFISKVVINSTGVTYPTIKSEKLVNLKVSLPSSFEQTQIVSFLDTKTQKIDELIQKTEQKIELLKEKRTSLINHCVTKGLNPDVEMKDSGVEWIGEIPNHWGTTKLKYQGDVIIGLSYKPENQVDEGQGILVMRSSNVQNGKPSFKDNVYVDCEISEKLKIKENDILICSRNGSRRLIGKNCLIPKEIEGMTWGVFMTVYRSKSPKFFHWLLNSPVFESQSGLFLTSTINQLTVSTLQSMVVPYVYELEEQTQIVEYLDEQTQKIDSTIEKETQRIELLKEYRQSLISEVVTGKIDVRGWKE